jgi:putative DNA primase/helicase
MSERPKKLDAAITKLDNWKLDKLEGLFDAKALAALAAVKQQDRVAYERLLKKWRQSKWPQWHELNREVDRLIKSADLSMKAAGSLDEDQPMLAAKRFRAEVHPTLIRWRDDWYVHKGSHYEIVEVDQVRGDLWRFLDTADGGAFDPNKKVVDNVMDALRGLALKERHAFEPPCWLDPKPGDPPASEILACRNGLLHLPTGELLPLTPRFFTCNGLTFDYDPKAPEPVVFLSFLDQLWEHDPEQIPLLQEVVGCLLTPDTSMQKFFLILGPPRSGKGTIVRLLTQLVGKRNTCSPTLESVGTRFGLETALGKTLATVSDMRLGKRTDKQGIVANILRITGEDDVDVERKHIGGAWTGKLAIRIVICSNQLPPLPDVSGALVARLVALTLERSFLNDEDRTLDRKLAAELPGILNWSIAGWRRVQEQADFTSTAASLSVADQIQTLASPLHVFLRDCCVLDPAAMVPKVEAWKAFQAFVFRRDLPPVYSSPNYFHRDLKVAAQYRITESRPVVEGKQVPHWLGIGLTAEGLRSEEFDDQG